MGINRSKTSVRPGFAGQMGRKRLFALLSIIPIPLVGEIDKPRRVDRRYHHAGFAAGACTMAASPGVLPAEPDVFWADVSRAVTESRFQGPAANCPPGAALVSGARETNNPITSVPGGWEQGFRS